MLSFPSSKGPGATGSERQQILEYEQWHKEFGLNLRLCSGLGANYFGTLGPNLSPLNKFDLRMASNKGLAIVVMGVSGAGKSTIGAMLAQVMNCRFIDADDYHPQANKDKMKAGISLSDEDRIPWLQALCDTLRVSLSNGETIILGCSALQKHYREILRSADLDYMPGSASSAVTFVHLSVEAEVLAARLEKRGNHFMPAKLLQSQLDLLQIDESEGIHKVDASHHPQETLKAIQDLVKHIISNTTKT